MVCSRTNNASTSRPLSSAEAARSEREKPPAAALLVSRAIDFAVDTLDAATHRWDQQAEASSLSREFSARNPEMC